MARRGKKPNVHQVNLLMRNGYSPANWLYVSEHVVGSEGFKQLGKNEAKTKHLVFVNRINEQILELVDE